MTDEERARSMLERVEKATAKAPLVEERKVELAAALLWLIERAEKLPEPEEEKE